MRSGTAETEHPDGNARGPDFIGIGAQRTGSSWIYACLLQHPGLCAPQKEINFFSRERNWSRGFSWYEGIFADCPPGALAGEFSTSYLADPRTPERIFDRYPTARLIVSLRHPVDRAYSGYLNDIVAGVVTPETPFAEALRAQPKYIDDGRYATHLGNYLQRFSRDQIHVSLFDDARTDPLATIQEMYRFLGVDPDFRPAMLDRPVGAGRVPRFQWLERGLLDSAGAFRRNRVLRPLWWRAKRLGLGDRLRSLNTSQAGKQPAALDPDERRSLAQEFEPEISGLEDLLQIELPHWRG